MRLGLYGFGAAALVAGILEGLARIFYKLCGMATEWSADFQSNGT